MMPILKAKEGERKTARYKQACELCLHACIKKIFPPDYLRLEWEGTTLQDGAGINHFGYPTLCSWVTDHPERDKICLCGKCGICTLSKSQWATTLDPPPFRTKEQAIAVYTQACRLESQGRSAQAREYCMRKGYINNSKQTAPLPPLVNSTWAFRFFSAYSCCPPEIMHDFSGLAKMSFR
jgi:hypothetical protein